MLSQRMNFEIFCDGCHCSFSDTCGTIEEISSSMRDQNWHYNERTKTVICGHCAELLKRIVCASPELLQSVIEQLQTEGNESV